ncbi:MAG TPA: hypothetical protein DDW65_22175 [Firmicutes bacterium]|jgi:membrane protease YdiL (CAAX protease family)|nr:hypothetical protein [Bacillota bacterium]
MIFCYRLIGGYLHPYVPDPSLNLHTLLTTILSISSICALIDLFILGPIIMEILLRGLLFNELRENMPLMVAIIIQGVFGISNFHIYISFQFSIGMILALIYTVTGSIWASILAHIFDTFLVVLGMLYGTTNDKYYILLLAIIGLLASCFYLWKKRPVSSELPVSKTSS